MQLSRAMELAKGEPEEVTLTWQNLTVYVTKPSGMLEWGQKGNHTKPILHNVSGIAYPGTLTAIMGASGAGKTTLMDALAGKHEENKVMRGEVLLNGLPLTRHGYQTAFVHQEDLFVGTLTVSEHLHFMAKLKLHKDTSKREVQILLSKIMLDLGLHNCEHTRIGIPGQLQGLSGGERKRLAFASEILTDPQLLFCDEPTTGLDSYSAQKLVEMMQQLASRGKTIICTIHQPSSQVFTMFDKLLLLAEGKLAYLGKADEAPAVFKKANLICPETYNPADFYVRTLAVLPGKEAESRKQIQRICDSFASSPAAKRLEVEISEHTAGGINDNTAFKTVQHQPLWMTQMIWLSWRALLNSYRDPKLHIVRTVQKILLAVLLGVCYFGITLNQMGIQDVQGAVFIFVTESTFPSLYGVLFVFPKQLPLFLRENKAGLYRSDAYYLSTMVSLLPGFIFEPLVFTTIAYWMVGLRPTIDAYLSTCFVIILTANVSAAFGCFFSAAFEDVTVAVTCMQPIDYLLKITGGLFINIGSLSPYLAWINFVSWFTYANEILSVSQWNNVANISCEGAPISLCVTNGEEVLESRSFTADNVQFDFSGLISLYFVFHAAGYIAIFFRGRRNRK